MPWPRISAPLHPHPRASRPVQRPHGDPLYARASPQLLVSDPGSLSAVRQPTPGRLSALLPNRRPSLACVASPLRGPAPSPASRSLLSTYKTTRLERYIRPARQPTFARVSFTWKRTFSSDDCVMIVSNGAMTFEP